MSRTLSTDTYEAEDQVVESSTASSDAESSDKEYFEEMQALAAKVAKDADWNGMFADYQTTASSQRGRAWTFIAYPESINPECMRILTELGLQGCISPLHDSDHWPDGSVKKSHLHGLLYFAGKKSQAQVKQIVDVLGGVMLQPVQNLVGMVRYFAHLDIKPEKVEADRGKSRYSVDDIVSFGGFDAMQYVRATQSQIAVALSELYDIVREERITAYCQLVDLIYTERVEYTFVMANPHVCNQLSIYIRSCYAVSHKDDELRKLRKAVKQQKRQIHHLIDGVDRMEMVFDRIAGLVIAGTASDTEVIAQDGCDDSTEQKEA